jgi:pimeloyl-ACP methyl ester carboxylesterase
LIVSHSYGTFVSSWFVKYRSDMVASLVAIDPVCFMVSVGSTHRGAGRECLPIIVLHRALAVDLPLCRLEFS